MFKILFHLERLIQRKIQVRLAIEKVQVGNLIPGGPGLAEEEVEEEHGDSDSDYEDQLQVCPSLIRLGQHEL